MSLKAVDEETYCLKTQAHAPYTLDGRSFCYRCGMFLGEGSTDDLGTLLDY